MSLLKGPLILVVVSCITTIAIIFSVLFLKASLTGLAVRPPGAAVAQTSTSISSVLLLVAIVAITALGLYKITEKPKPVATITRRDAIKEKILRPYVARAISHGLSPDLIRQSLLQYGWPQDLVDEELENARRI